MDRRTSHRSTSRRRAARPPPPSWWLRPSRPRAACRRRPGERVVGASGGWSHGADVTRTAISDDLPRRGAPGCRSRAGSTPAWRPRCRRSSALGAARPVARSPRRRPRPRGCRRPRPAPPGGEGSRDGVAVRRVHEGVHGDRGRHPRLGHVTKSRVPGRPPSRGAPARAPTAGRLRAPAAATSTTPDHQHPSTGRAGIAVRPRRRRASSARAQRHSAEFVATGLRAKRRTLERRSQEAIRSVVAIGIGAARGREFRSRPRWRSSGP